MTFEPPLAAVPQKGGLILNGKEKTSFALDLRLAPKSPARTGAERPPGADLDVQAFARGDVDSDGTIDIRRPE